MSADKFTPGPWEFEEHQLSEGYSCIVYAANGMRVGTDYLGRADAALIAAAPDLYSALERIVLLHANFSTAPAWQAARAALAKAKGSTP